MSSLKQPALPAQVRIVVDMLGLGSKRRAVRRPILVDRTNGLIYELPTIFIYRQLKGKSLNTQRAALHDLAFFLAWVALKRKRDVNWSIPEARVQLNQLALTEREINSFCSWCQKHASDLSHALQKEKPGVASIAAGTAVDSQTTNRRIQTVCNYLVWLTREFIEGTLGPSDQSLVRSVMYEKRIRQAFEKQLNSVKKSSPVRSLSEVESSALRSLMQTSEIFPNTVHGNRDRLIARLFLASGLRSGELLKLYTTDVEDHYVVRPGKVIGTVNVVRKPNDARDERVDEPASKTFPGKVQIPSRLASEIKAYVIGDRRIAIDRRNGSREHPLLFVCHSGPQMGKPIGRRNLNRIIAKLKKGSGMPTSIAPHTLRHTHLTEFADSAEAAGISDENIRTLLISRGHWAPESKMPAHYTKRRTERLEAEMIAERDRRIAPKKND